MKRVEQIVAASSAIAVCLSAYLGALAPMRVESPHAPAPAPAEQPVASSELPLALLTRLKDIRTAGTRNLFEFVREAVPVNSNKVSATPKGAAIGFNTPSSASGAAPTAPPFPLKFYGWVERRTAVARAFFCDGDNIYIRAEGETVAGRYRIVRIRRATVELEDLRTRNRISLQLAEDAVTS